MNFEDKIKKTIGLISSVVGLPTNNAIFKKYKVSAQFDSLPEDLHFEKITIKETYLTVPRNELEDKVKKHTSICVR